MISVPFGSHQKEGFGEHQAQVHRYQLQNGSRSVPNAQGQNGLHGTSQEGFCQDRDRCLDIFPMQNFAFHYIFYATIGNICSKIIDYVSNFIFMFN